VTACGSVTSVTIDGYSYPTVSIGTQCWTKENLRVRRYSDGTEIRFDKSGTSTGSVSQTWSGTGRNYGAYTLYAHDSVSTPSNLSNYGYLYNWYAVNGIVTDGGTSTKNICAIGWHVPTNTEWITLISYVGTSSGTVMKENNALWTTDTGTNTSGFSALPGGMRSDGSGSFLGIREFAAWWSATETDGSNALGRRIYGTSNSLDGIGGSKSVGLSVRCLKD
jgi:uncharacterized protein (TIGR02145 family)